MSEEGVATEALLEFLNGVEAGIAAARHLVSEAKGVKPSVNENTFNVLSFERQTGARIGEFEVASKTNNLPDKWQHAHQVLRQNNATINTPYHGADYRHNYWLYKDAIYRKLRKGKEPEPQAKVDVIENVKAKFPSDLETLLTFSQERGYVIIKPREYLGSETFAKIASIVRGEGGEYISQGKQSRFRRGAAIARTFMIQNPIRPFNNDVMALYGRVKSATGGNNVTFSLCLARFIPTDYKVKPSPGTWSWG